jgi:fucose permease
VLFLLALGGFVAIGLPEGALGVAWPSIRATFDQPLSALGVLIAAATAGYFTTSLIAGRVAARVGTGTLLVAATSVGTVGMTLNALAPAWWVLVLGSLLAGSAGGVLDTAINAWVALCYGAARLGVVHAAYGIGATASPLLLALLLATGSSWRWAYAAVLVVEVLLLAGFGLTRHDWSTSTGPAPTSAPDGASENAGRPPAPSVFVVLTVAAFFVYVGVEASAGQWSFSLLTEERSVDAGAAAVWVGAYWAALTIGRLLMGAVANRFHPDTLVTASLAGMFVGALILWSAPADVVAGLGLVLLGFSAAAVFPTMIAVTPLHVGSDRASAVIGYQVAAAALGGALVPIAVGLLAESVGLAVVGPVLVVSIVVLALLVWATRRNVPNPP